MKTINAGGMASTLLEHIRRIRTRTWVLIGVAFMLSLALAVWAVVAVLGALWGGAQTIIGTAPSAFEAAKQRVAQHTQTLSTAAKEQLAQNVPQLPTSVEQAKAELAKQTGELTQRARDQLAQAIPQLPTSVENAKAELAKHTEELTRNARDQLAQAAPNVASAIDQASLVGLQTVAAATVAAAAAGVALADVANLPAEALPARDVSGEDLGPVRYQGLARIAWRRDQNGSRVSYEGRADYFDVLSYYQREFSALGFTQSVISATPKQETLRFSNGDEVLTLKIEAKPPLVSVDILSVPRS